MKVAWSRRAIRHLIHLREYIEKDSEQNASLVANRILKLVDLLQTHPEIGRPGRAPGMRELVVTDTPYVIPYRVRRGRLELIAVFHGRQKWPLKPETVFRPMPPPAIVFDRLSPRRETEQTFIGHGAFKFILPLKSGI
jgi:toxin ParE1/3/4